MTIRQKNLSIWQIRSENSSRPKSMKAVAGIANHLAKFWDPSMRKKIIQHLMEGGEGLDPLVKEAVRRVGAKYIALGGYAGDA